MDVGVTPFLTRQQLAQRYLTSPGTLANWAVRRKGPRYRLIGGRVLYRLADVEEWEAEQWGIERPREPHRDVDSAASADPEPEISESVSSVHVGAEVK